MKVKNKFDISCKSVSLERFNIALKAFKESLPKRNTTEINPWDICIRAAMSLETFEKFKQDNPDSNFVKEFCGLREVYYCHVVIDDIIPFGNVRFLIDHGIIEDSVEGLM